MTEQVPSGLIFELRSCDGARLSFDADGSRWAPILGIAAMITGGMACLGVVMGNVTLVATFAALAVLCGLMCLRAMASHLHLEVDGASGVVTCRGAWMRQPVHWTRAAHDIRDVTIARCGEEAVLVVLLMPAGRHASDNDRVIYLSSRALAAQQSEAEARSLASRVSMALQIEVDPPCSPSLGR